MAFRENPRHPPRGGGKVELRAGVANLAYPESDYE